MHAVCVQTNLSVCVGLYIYIFLASIEETVYSLYSVTWAEFKLTVSTKFQRMPHEVALVLLSLKPVLNWANVSSRS